MNRSASNFLFTTWEGGGSVPPVLTLAGELVRRGHRVRVVSDRVNRKEAELTGATFVPWTSAPSRCDRFDRNTALRDWNASSSEEGFTVTLRSVMTGPALDYARDILAELQREPADLVVSSEMLFGVIAACEKIRQKIALFAPNLCLFPITGMPVFGAGLRPPKSAAERAEHAQIRQAVLDLLDSAGLAELNAARISLGLAPLAHVIEQFDAADAYLLGTSRAFDFPAEAPPAKLRYVGAQLGEPGWVAPWSAPWPAGDRRPLVAVGFSTTFQNHAGALQTVIDAAAALPVRALATLGVLRHDEIRCADNVWAVPSAPHDAVMQDAAVVVTHGGHGTVLRALKHGRPMLLIPHGRDQDDNAVRVAERGAGLVLPATASVDTVRGALTRLLEEPSFTTAARQLGAAIAAEDSSICAAAELEAMAAAR